MHVHRNPSPPPSTPPPEPEQVPGFDERDAGRGQRGDTNVEGGPDRGTTTPVDTEGT